MISNITLYYNTGFNKKNIPDSPSLLNSCFNRELEGHWDYQDFFLSSLKIKTTWDTVNNADYLKYGRAYYFITGISMINENNAEISLELDALTTMGGANSQEYVEGIITRAHSKTDNIFENIIDEPIGCSEQLIIRNESEMGAQRTDGTIQIIMSTADLSGNLSEEMEAIGFTLVGEESASVSIPKSPNMAQQTIITYNGPDGTNYTISGDEGVGYYLYNDITKANLQTLRSCGLETCALYSYGISDYYCNIAEGTRGHLGSIFNETKDGNGTNYDEGYTDIKNNKTYMMYNKYVVRSNTSGDSQEYECYDIIDEPSVHHAPLFKLTADPQYGGRPYCTPAKYEKRTIKNPTFKSVQGLPWYQIPIAYTQASGQLWTNAGYVMGQGSQMTDASNLLISSLESVLTAGMNTTNVNVQTQAQFTPGMGGDPGTSSYGSTNLPGLGLVNAGFNAMRTGNKLKYSEISNNLEYDKKSVVAPQLSTSPALGLQRVIPNNFTVYHITPSNKDIQAIDKYFTMYGYAQPNIVFDKSYLTGRQHFNYIQCSGVKIARGTASDPYGIGVKSMAENQLISGVRIWHTLPSKVSSNPIV